ncbi:MAG: helix-turn-helix domain-containing protein, partial [Proteobacteria bacterium]|nr:helix-turn-helix domain-containing protein [Pseudomonadota bacterium]
MTDEDKNTVGTDLKSIGDILRTKREKLSYTLEHVSEVTRISYTCLKNIESGNLDQLPGLVFTRGFIRNYAKMIGLDSDWMIEALNKAYDNHIEEPSNTDNEIHALRQQSKKQVSTNFGPISVVLVTLIVIIAGIWYWQSDPNNTVTISKEDTIEAVSEVAPQAVDVPDAIAVDIPVSLTEEEKAILEEEEEPKPEIKISPLNLVLIARRDEWIHLVVDNKKPFKLRLEKGKRYEWPAEEIYSLTMTTGDTASVHLNGEEIEISENLF